MKRSLLTLLMTWLLMVQASLAFTSKTPANDIENSKKYLNDVIANYNAFATGPATNDFPKAISSENSKVLKDYMNKNKITGALPLAKLTEKGTIELRMKGQNTVLEINPTLGTIRFDNDVLILKSNQNLKNYLKQIEKFLAIQKSANNNAIKNTVDTLFSLIVSTASADCLSKYDAVIEAKMPKRKGYYKTDHPAMWVMATGMLMALLLMPANFAILPAYGGMLTALYVDDKDGEIRREERRVRYEIEDLILIDGALRVAKTGKDPSGRITDEESYNPDHFRFFDLYNKYTEIVKKQNTPPLSREEFLKKLAEGDSKEKFCTPLPIETIDKFVEKIILPAIDPNIVNNSAEPIANTNVLDEARKDDPKPVSNTGIEQQNDPNGATAK